MKDGSPYQRREGMSMMERELLVLLKQQPMTLDQMVAVVQATKRHVGKALRLLRDEGCVCIVAFEEDKAVFAYGSKPDVAASKATQSEINRAAHIRRKMSAETIKLATPATPFGWLIKGEN